MDLTEGLVFELLYSDQEFPVDFDNAWQWLGYSTKQKALKTLKSNFKEGIDFLTFGLKSPSGGRPSDYIALTIDCFKLLGMIAGTSKGREVRYYFLACEKRLKLLLNEAKSQNIKTSLISAIVSKEVVSKEPKFKDWFYEMLYRKRGGDWSKRPTKNRPACVGVWTNQIVYDLMLGGTSDESVKASLNAVEPKIDGVRKHPLHTHFSEFGINYLQQHFQSLQLIDRIVPDGDWERFMYYIKKAFPVEGMPMQLELFYELEKFSKSS